MPQNSLIHQEREKIKQIILERLRKGPAYRIELHRLCCQKLGKSTKSSFVPSRVCADMPDSHFDTPLKELLMSGLIKKIGNIAGKGNFTYYQLTEKKESFHFSC